MAAQAAGVCRRRAAAEGLGSHQNAVKYLGQDFEALKQQCLDSGELFKDPEFPACPSALGYKELGPGSPQTQGIIWKRPTELSPSPQFIVGGASRTDVCQGDLGDCWLLAAIASLTLNERLLSRVVPADQSFQENYAGIFHFQFWQYGEWVEVVVDDRLPTRDGRLLFLHSAEGTEFWSALLEKAYAKLNGSYEALAGGSTVEGFEDFTGGISEFYDLRKPPANLYRLIRKALRKGSLLGCSIEVSSVAEAEAITRQRLVKSHAYSVTGAEEVEVLGHLEQLIRLRNPWGEVEWTGAWSDSAPEWSRIDPRRREELGRKAEDGEFWMSFSDFLEQFSRLEICNLSPDSLSSEEAHQWSLLLLQGRWARGATAGGCQNYPATYWTNPQFKIHLDEADEDQEEGMAEPCCTALVGLMQKDRRRRRRLGQGLLSIGFAVYQVPKELASHTDTHLGRDFFHGHQPAARSGAYVNLWEVWGRVQLPPGEYLLVPSTFEPFKDGDFCLRVFSEKKARALEVGDVVAGVPHEPQLSEGGHGDPELLSLCEELTGKYSEIGANELKKVLNGAFSTRTDMKFDGFSIHTCREMVSLLDSTGTGTLRPAELRTLWLKIWKYLEIYQEVAHNQLGTMEAHEMRTALRKAGFTLNSQVQQTIASRCSGGTLHLDFDGFVACVVRLETLFKLFKLLDQNQTGIIQLSLAEWLCCVLV
ncbi:calpain-8 [Octodon degus]|uniref:Calpain-8 n=1 Tax=Octodon degus TaxID=10160 RepID=A0A6P3EMT9_OCTDE|nr:calpain-8 [Octodon degus]